MCQVNDVISGVLLTLHKHEVILWPERWTALQLPTNLTWTTVPFLAQSTSVIADVAGVYAFVIQPQTPLTLITSYLMYVGKTDRSLRQRFREYLRERDQGNIRPKLLRILPLYGEHLFFAFAPVSTGHTPTNIEAALLGAFIPPGNDQINVQVNRIRKAFQ
jgi:hypothetical protein